MNVPQGSKIVVTTDERGFPKYVLPMSSNGFLRIFPAIFLVAWLGGWGVGEWRVIRSLFEKGTPAAGASAFEVFWLIGWTVGGIMALLFLLRLLRPTVPETLVFNSSSLDYDGGCPPFKYDSNQRQGEPSFRTLFPTRVRVSLTLPQIRTFRLQDGRLTVDIGIERKEVGVGLTVVEKEWLFETLKNRYSF